VSSWYVSCVYLTPFNLSNALKQGLMAGYDQKSNVVLSDSKERRVDPDNEDGVGVEEIPLGLYLVKGDMM
jgi:small nuclear ribonucleoprotein (snRNP)-like protein